jgi:SAM-dependent methyltransferase
MAEHGTVVGVDTASDALGFVRERRPRTRPVQATLEALPFADASFDVVVGITVLYSVPDDQRAVRELGRVLAPGGAAVLFEPAFASLRRAHDTTVHGRRRYRRGDLAGLARRAGLSVRRATYAYSFLVPPAAVLATADRLRRAPAEMAPSDVDKRALDAVFAPLADTERRWLLRRDVPVGTSAVVLATRD